MYSTVCDDLKEFYPGENGVSLHLSGSRALIAALPWTRKTLLFVDFDLVLRRKWVCREWGEGDGCAVGVAVPNVSQLVLSLIAHPPSTNEA